MRFIIASLIALIFFLGFFIIDNQEVTEVSPVQFLPNDTTVYLDLENGFASVGKFQESRFGKTISEIDLVEVSEYLDLDPIFISRLEKLRDNFRDVKDNKLFLSLLGSKFSVALFPERTWSPPLLPAGNYLKKQTLFISKQHSFRSVITTAKRLYPKMVERAGVPYGQYRIRRFSIGHDTIAAAFVDGYVLLTMEERLLREALYVRDNAAINLNTNPSFSRIRRNIETSDRKLYVDLSVMREMSETIAAGVHSPREQAFLAELSNLKGFPTAGYGAWRQGPVLRDSLMVEMDYEKILPLTGRMLKNKPESNATLPFVVEDVLLYYWSNTLNARLLWKMYREERASDGHDISGMTKSTREITGYTVEELTEMMGNDIGLILRPSEHEQFIPIPDTALFIKLKDRKKIKEAVDHSADHFKISLQSRRYKSVKYYYWGLYPMENLQPVYTIHKGYLIVANTLNIFKSIVDLMADKEPLSSSIKFAPIDPGFREKNNSVCYVDQKTLLGQFRELASWAGTMLAIQDRRAAAKSKILIDRLINPLLLGLTMYEKSATRTYIDKNWIITEARTQKELILEKN
ncbi:DUF3352 domain-containing protein [Desulfopila sp. IMCC35008]|uniref:DUF3352 domain-containing protein n=1 Tax=Desulfopila sp. IMCC35008 TaxID=2653858 RepID=UPI0013D2B047|nr:DUF3352 domain-containing protein [Desulfopila sp. IMCC35008]